MPNISAMLEGHLAQVDAIQRSVYPKPLQEDLSLFRNAMSAKNSICLVAEQGGNIAGYILTYPTIDTRLKFETGYQHEPEYNAIYIHDLSINPANQKQGIAKLILDEFYAKTKASGFKKIMAIAVGDALPFWISQGFSDIEPCIYHGQSAYRIEKPIA